MFTAQVRRFVPPTQSKRYMYKVLGGVETLQMVSVASSPRPEQDHATVRIRGTVLQWHPHGSTVDLDGHEVFVIYDLIDTKAKVVRRPQQQTVKIEL